MTRLKIPRSGFSLLEILTALAVSTMLLIVVMGVTARIARVNGRMIEAYPNKSWQTILVDSLQSDFENCRSITVSSSQIVLM